MNRTTIAPISVLCYVVDKGQVTHNTTQLFMHHLATTEHSPMIAIFANGKIKLLEKD